MRFTQAYAGSLVCAPSRCILMTGLHTGHCRNPDTGEDPLSDKDLTVAEILKAGGYKTGMFGKWSLGPPGTTRIPDRQGFDDYHGVLNQRQAHSYYPKVLYRNGKAMKHNGKQYAPDVFTEGALSFIKANKDQPFFLYWPTTIPHAGMHVPEDEPSLAGYKQAFGKEKPFPGKGGYIAQSTPNAARAAMITRMDRDIGKMIELLKRLGLYDRTIIFFSSDNGPSAEGGTSVEFFKARGVLRGGPPLGAKHLLYEGGIRMPLIVSWRGRIRPNTTSDAQVPLWDFLPTACDLAKRAAPTKVDGISFLPTLLGNPQIKRHDHLYWEWVLFGDQRAIRKGDWKLITCGRGPNCKKELYNLKDDIGEQRNLAPELPEKTNELYIP